MSNSAALNAALAAHRFGLGEPSLAPLLGDAPGWLLAQIGPADTARGDGLLSTAQAVALADELRQQVQQARRIQAPAQPEMAAVPNTVDQAVNGRYREIALVDIRSRIVTSATTRRPFAERLSLFWANHFTVSLAKASARGLAGAFERDAIRPHIAGSFESLLVAATTHPAMLHYLDNQLSAGPHSRVVERGARRGEGMERVRRITGLNENLAREVLELHTLGVNGGYGQADVTSFARILTGWRTAPLRPDAAQAFDAAWHEPGGKVLLGKSYPEGPEALRQALHDLAGHPSTARFLATKLARHFIADDPPAPVVERLVATYRRTDGQLAEVYRELLRAPEAWAPEPAKLKTPEEFVVSAVRVLGLANSGSQPLFDRPDSLGIVGLGQRPMAAPSPAGWPDRAEDWLGPDAVWKRVEWATRTADRLGRSIDARALAQASLGPLLSENTMRQIERAADGPQALALLLLAPEFQRR